MTADLTILCVTQHEPFADRFLAAFAEIAGDVGANYVEHDGSGAGCIEHVLDDAIASCPDGYILRVDDDESVTFSMVRWLARREFVEADHWAFPRRHFFPDRSTYIASAPLYPDLQTRLSVKAKAGGRSGVHDGSPHGTGTVAPVHLNHHKFLVRSYEERRAIVERYEAIRPGAGHGFREFSLPEDAPDLEIRHNDWVMA